MPFSTPPLDVPDAIGAEVCVPPPLGTDLGAIRTHTRLLVMQPQTRLRTRIAAVGDPGPETVDWGQEKRADSGLSFIVVPT